MAKAVRPIVRRIRVKKHGYKKPTFSLDPTLKFFMDQAREDKQLFSKMIDNKSPETKQEITLDSADSPTISIPTGRGEVKINIRSRLGQLMLSIAMVVLVLILSLYLLGIRF